MSTGECERYKVIVIVVRDMIEMRGKQAPTRKVCQEKHLKIYGGLRVRQG